MLQSETIHYFLILARRLGIAAELIVPGAPGYVRSIRVHSRQSSWNNVIFILIGVAMELGDAFQILERQVPGHAAGGKSHPN